jgi:ribose 5-phosphate isomerase A
MAEAAKRRAAERAVDLVKSGMRLGLGTGSTARHVVDVITERLVAGSLQDIVAVPTSRATEEQARTSGIPLTTLDITPVLDLTIDGADEIDPALDLIKGLGGALLWEKMVAYASARVCIVADDTKRVDRLGTRAPLPVEVVQFGWKTHLAFLRSLGAEPVLREREGAPFVTDGGHFIIDATFPDGIESPGHIEAALKRRTGIVESGLFLGIATHVVIGGRSEASLMERVR